MIILTRKPCAGAALSPIARGVFLTDTNWKVMEHSKVCQMFLGCGVPIVPSGTTTGYRFGSVAYLVGSDHAD
ncbi:MAG: hypothetical protein JWN30_525 [Bacilli bacterium]|nr:hypothetical protein [Bacilli bacterium]